MIPIFKSIMLSALLSTIMIIAILLVRKIFSKKLHIEILSFLWLLVIIRLAIPVTPEIGIHTSEFIPVFASDTSDAHSDTPSENITESAIDTPMAESESFTSSNDEKSSENSIINNEQVFSWNKLINNFSENSIILYLSYIWIAGAAIALISKGFILFRFRAKLSTATPISDYLILKMIYTNRKIINLKRNVAIRECAYIDAPATYGVLYPKILLPFGFASTLSEEKQNLIILHELYHIKKLDIAKNYLWLMAGLIYWFNPLLPFAHSKYINDTELHCDSLVLKTFIDDKCRVYSQSLLDVVKLSNGEIKLPIALSFCEDRSNLRKRVENMIQPTKKKKHAAIVSILTATIITFACLTTACMPASNISNAISSEPTESKHIIFEAQPHENVKISVDADIDVPIDKTIDLVRVVPKNISDEQLDSFIDYVILANSVYDGKIMKKSDYVIENDDSYLKYEQIGAVYTQITPYTKDNKKSYLELTQSINGTDSQLAYWRFDDGYSFGIPTDYAGKDIERMKKSYEDCLEISEELIRKLDGDDTSFRLEGTFCYDNNVSFPMYRFFFYKEYYGIISTPASLLLEEKNNYSYSNFINVFVDDKGIFEVWWLNSAEKPEVVENDVTLMDFDKIAKAFKTYINDDFTWNTGKNRETDFGTPAVITINNAHLNVILVPESDNSGSYIATPVWEFIGNMQFDEPVNIEGQYEITEQQDICIVRINAIDGTIMP